MSKSETQSRKNIFEFSAYAVSRCDSGYFTLSRFSLRNGS